MANKKNKKNNEKRVLAAALCISVVAIAGSTFAWFTSKDEVTNRLSASAAYDVSIAEDFQPPEDWIPGQTINKDVSAVNTGNVDAFVRMWLEGEMSLMKKTSIGIPDTINPDLDLDAVDAGDTMYALGFKFKDSDRYYKVLSTTERANAALNGTDTAVNDNTYSEVKSVQAGGYLVSAPAGAVWTYTTEQQTEITNKYGEKQIVPAGTVVGSKNATSGTSAEVNVEANCPIDSDTFVPQTPGLYIFRRNIALGNANTADTYEYSGYVFDGTNYFALANDTAGNSDYTLPVGAVTVATSTSPQAEPLTYELHDDYIKLYTASETVVKNDNLTWTYDDTAGAEKLTATYGTGDEAIFIDVALANIGTTGETWTAKEATDKTTTFYYNNDLEAGDSSAKLVDSVTLSPNTKNEAFLAFDFDLNVFLESVQVTIGENGNEKTTPVEGTNGAFASTTDGKAPASATAQDAAEIADIAWN